MDLDIGQAEQQCTTPKTSAEQQVCSVQVYWDGLQHTQCFLDTETAQTPSIVRFLQNLWNVWTDFNALCLS